MTAPRRNLKKRLQARVFLALIAVSGLPLAGFAATTERVVANRYSGLAIDGVDPVAYFTDARPMHGVPEFEVAASGVVWRFRNESNKAFFVAHPEIYAPQFGGYDPVDIGRGVAFAGNPQFWLIIDRRLYLFGREETRVAFAATPQDYLREAASRWAALQLTLAQ